MRYFFFALILATFGCKKEQPAQIRLEGEAYFDTYANQHQRGNATIFFDYGTDVSPETLRCYLNREDETFVFESDCFNFAQDTVFFRSNCWHTDDGDRLEPHNEIHRNGQLQIEFAAATDWWTKFDECNAVRFSIPVTN